MLGQDYFHFVSTGIQGILVGGVLGGCCWIDAVFGVEGASWVAGLR